MSDIGEEPWFWPGVGLQGPHIARMYDYYLDGKDHYAADRDAAEQVLSRFPQVRIAARANRAFMRRAVRFLADQAGIRQFLDIGTGLPTSPNLHEVAQQVAPTSRILYVDNDPMVLAHARALLPSHPGGHVAYLEADLCEPGSILAAAELHETLDLREPVALTLMAVLHFVPDDSNPYSIVGRLMEALPTGSYLAISHGTADFAPAAVEASAEDYRTAGIPVAVRSRAEVARFFAGLELVPPGVEVVTWWRPDEASRILEAIASPPPDAHVSLYAAVGRKMDSAGAR